MRGSRLERARLEGEGCMGGSRLDSPYKTLHGEAMRDAHARITGIIGKVCQDSQSILAKRFESVPVKSKTAAVSKRMPRGSLLAGCYQAVKYLLASGRR